MAHLSGHQQTTAEENEPISQENQGSFGDNLSLKSVDDNQLVSEHLHAPIQTDLLEGKNILEDYTLVRPETGVDSVPEEIDYQESLSDFEEKERQIQSEVVLEQSFNSSHFRDFQKELTTVEEESDAFESFVSPSIKEGSDTFQNFISPPQEEIPNQFERLASPPQEEKPNTFESVVSEEEAPTPLDTVSLPKPESSTFERFGSAPLKEEFENFPSPKRHSPINDKDLKRIVEDSYSSGYLKDPPPAYSIEEIEDRHRRQIEKQMASKSDSEDDDTMMSRIKPRPLSPPSPTGAGGHGITSGLFGLTNTFANTLTGMSGINVQPVKPGPASGPLSGGKREESIEKHLEPFEPEGDSSDDMNYDSPLSTPPVQLLKKGAPEDLEANLPKSITDIFDMIEDYTPKIIIPPYEPIPFIPDYVAAVGVVDPFIKIPRPDEVEDNLGLTILDEPASKQSDPNIVGMRLHRSAKDVNRIKDKDAPIQILEKAHKKGEEIKRFIENMKELKGSKQSASVYYNKKMPDIEKLMQEWPEEVEEALTKIKLPTAELDVPLEEFADICLNLTDIPVHQRRIQSLHVFFTLYSEFKSSQHFKNFQLNSNYNANNYEVFDKRKTDRLEL
uniref:Intraflagellar transport protein 46 homolog n=1 Tax=Rhabditophanes sp. KR3021 TaxID=114890 RepID=A0AC35U8B2_9BILA